MFKMRVALRSIRQHVFYGGGCDEAKCESETWRWALLHATVITSRRPFRLQMLEIECPRRTLPNKAGEASRPGSPDIPPCSPGQQ